MTTLPLLLLSATLSGTPGAQAPVPAPQPAPPTAPATRPAAQRPRAQSAATSTLEITVADPGGLPLQGVGVTATGTLDREGTTLASGLVRFLNMRGGEYRLRFAHPRFVLLERDVVIRAGQSLSIDVTLSRAGDQSEEPEKPDTPPPAPTPASAPAGEPRTVAVVDFVERNFISGRDPLKEDQLGCTASAKTTLMQVRDPLPERALAEADEVIYVVAGEGTLRLGNRDVALSATTLAVVPRGTVRGVTRKGRNPLIFVSVLSGPACTR
jgi:mannose-6-phosphate isomerase-like protein (cupin superfamily)